MTICISLGVPFALVGLIIVAAYVIQEIRS